MKFNIIVGNPPYQVIDGGGMGASALPIYHKFVEISQQIKPDYLSMIMPSRWFTGGRGLDSFRETMLKDERLEIIHDYVSASACFSNVEIKGGICYFLWNKNHNGDCRVSTHYETGELISSNRPLLEEGMDCFVRDGRFVSIMKKVKSMTSRYFSELVSANDPFGFDMREENSYKRVKLSFLTTSFDDSVSLYYNGWRKDGIGYISKEKIRKNAILIDAYKFLIPKAWGTGDISSDWLKPFVPNTVSCCTETYLVVGPFNDEKERNNALKYTQTRFFHLLVFIIKNTQNTMQKAYSVVPIQDFTNQSDIDWSKPVNEIDKQLYSKYNLSEEEIAFIEKMIKPM